MSRLTSTAATRFRLPQVSRRLGLVMGSMLLAGLATIACTTSGGAAGKGGATGVLTASSTPATTSTTGPTPTTTTSTTLADCGATRDPFDPTNSPPPAGSAANC